MDQREFTRLLSDGLASLARWQESWQRFETDSTLQLSPDQISEVIGELTDRLQDNFPLQHPRYAAQMLKPPHAIAMLAYTLAMQINPNNHALDASQATSAMEKEVIADLASMFGYGDTYLGHLTSSGTIANLEALWVARSLHPGKVIAASDQAHYTHGRMAEVINSPFVSIASDAHGRMDLNALEASLRTGQIGTVVATAGTTGLGAVDQIQEIVPLARRYGARVHVDAAYGGFFTLLARASQPPIDPLPFLAIAEADSVVVDPHKHGLQPYGCGSVLFRDPSIGRFYMHDSPYTYFTSDELHYGEISLECSRAGAAAAAVWATVQCFPLRPDSGLGPILTKGRDAALKWAALLNTHDRFRLVVQPELDILSFYPVPEHASKIQASEISALTDRVYRGTMEDPDEPVFLAKYVVSRELLSRNDSSIEWDEPTVTVLRSVLMKPEHLDFVPRLHQAVERHLS